METQPPSAVSRLLDQIKGINNVLPLGWQIPTLILLSIIFFIPVLYGLLLSMSIALTWFPLWMRLVGVLLFAFGVALVFWTIRASWLALKEHDEALKEHEKRYLLKTDVRIFSEDEIDDLLEKDPERAMAAIQESRIELLRRMDKARSYNPHLSPGLPTRFLNDGPYRLGRHPLCNGWIIATMGMGLMINNAWVLLLVFPTMLLIGTGLLAHEEKFLRAHWGPVYTHYCKNNNRWFLQLF